MISQSPNQVLFLIVAFFQVFKSISKTYKIPVDSETVFNQELGAQKKKI